MRNIMIRNRLLSIFLTVAILLTLFGGVSLPATAEDSTDQQSNQNEETSGKTYSYPALFAPEQGKDGFSYYTGVSVDTLQPATYKNNIWVDAAPLNNAGEAFQMAGNGAIVPGNGKIAALGFKVPEDGVLSADVVFDKIGNDDPDISRWENAYANGIILSVIHKKADGQVELYSKEVKTFLFARNMVAFHIPETAVKQGDELLFAFDSNPLSADTGSTGKASNWKDGGYLDLTIYMSESEETLAVGQYDYTNATAHSWPGAWVGDATKVSEVPAKFTQGTGGFSHYITAPRWNSTTWNTFDPIKDNYIYLNDSYLTMSNGVPASNGLTTYIPRYFALGANGYFCPGQWGEYAVISYTAEKDGTLLLDWQITNQPGANQTEIWHMLGYQLHIYKNTEKIYTKPISNTANADVYNINLAVDVKAGDVLYFAVDPDNGEVAGAANGTYDWTGYGIDWSDNGTMDLSILAVEKNPEKPDAPILSTDATLHSLAVSGVTLSPEFDPSELSYAATVNTNTAEITLTASCEAKARMYVNDALTASGNPINVRLAIGANTVKIKVVAEDGTDKVYTLVITRETPVIESDRLRLEAENGKLSNCVVYSGFKDASGGFCVGQMDYPNSTAELSFEIASAGLYKVTVGYTAGYGDATGLVRLGNGNEMELIYKSTEEWNVFAETSFVIEMKQGGNTLCFRKANGFSSLDYIVIEKAPAGTKVPQYYEAENATMNNCVVYKDFSFATNGLCAGQIDNLDSYVEFKVNVPAAGMYRMGIRYSTGYDTNPVMLIGVNGGAGVPLTLPLAGKWNDWFTVYTTVALNAGENVIRIQKAAGFAAIDYISLLSTNEEAPKPGFVDGKLKLELETGKLNNCVIYSAFVNASGGLCIGQFDYVDSTVEIPFELIKTGLYKITVGYTAGYGDATGLVRLGNGNERELIYKSTGEWDSFAETSFVIEMNKGDNTLRFRKSNGFCSLDYIIIEEAPADAAAPQYYEAEDATLNNCVIYEDFYFASNGLCAGEIDFNDSYVEFKVNVAAAGTYHMGIRYSTGYDSNPAMLVGVNGGKGASLVLPKAGAWDDWFTIYTNVKLVAGENVIRIQKSAGFAAIDYISLTPEGNAAEDGFRFPTTGESFTDSVSPSVKAPTTQQKPPALQPQTPSQTTVEADTTWFCVLMVIVCGLGVIGTAALYIVAFAQDKKRRQDV